MIGSKKRTFTVRSDVWSDLVDMKVQLSELYRTRYEKVHKYEGEQAANEILRIDLNKKMATEKLLSYMTRYILFEFTRIGKDGDSYNDHNGRIAMEE